jgi:hypothetical protein
MSQEKNFFSLFARYQPSDAARAVLAGASDIQRRLDADRRMVQVSCHFPSLVEKRLIGIYDVFMSALCDLTRNVGISAMITDVGAKIKMI